jgi:hypothetical protein
MSNLYRRPSIDTYQVHVLAQNPNLEFFSIYSNKFFHNFHLSKSSFTCPTLPASGLAQRILKCEKLTDDGRQVMAKAHIDFGKAS